MRQFHFVRSRPSSRQRTAPAGFTLLELLVVTIVFTILVALLIPVGFTRCCANSSRLKDVTQIQQIHKGMLMWAADNKGVMPRPSLIAMNPSAFITQPDRTLNTSAFLFSAMIAQNFVTPEIFVSPVEVNPLVTVEESYNYSQYRPAKGIFWDSQFTADPSRSSNASYAHLAMCGARSQSHWKDTSSWITPHLGNRATGGGPFGLGGATQGPDHDRSITLEMHGDRKQWSGNMVFADNHLERITGLTHPAVTYQPAGAATPLLDNFFAAEFLDAWVNEQAKPEASGDAWLGLFIEASADGLSSTPRFDPLTPP